MWQSSLSCLALDYPDDAWLDSRDEYMVLETDAGSSNFKYLFYWNKKSGEKKWVWHTLRFCKKAQTHKSVILSTSFDILTFYRWTSEIQTEHMLY
jgi:hypothetical protein